MKLGSKIVLKIFLVLLFMKGIVYCEERIRSVPLINLDTIKPSFEETDAKNETLDNDKTIKAKKNKVRFNKKKVILTGLDKITAKTLDIDIILAEKKTFGNFAGCAVDKITVLFLRSFELFKTASAATAVCGSIR